MTACALAGCGNDRPHQTGLPEKPAGKTVFIGGMVKTPGYYPWHAGMTVGDLADSAGGIRFGADNITIFTNFYSIDEGKRLAVMPGDRKMDQSRRIGAIFRRLAETDTIAI